MLHQVTLTSDRYPFRILPHPTPLPKSGALAPRLRPRPKKTELTRSPGFRLAYITPSTIRHIKPSARTTPVATGSTTTQRYKQHDGPTTGLSENDVKHNPLALAVNFQPHNPKRLRPLAATESTPTKKTDTTHKTMYLSSHRQIDRVPYKNTLHSRLRGNLSQPYELTAPPPPGGGGGSRATSTRPQYQFLQPTASSNTQCGSVQFIPHGTIQRMLQTPYNENVGATVCTPTLLPEPQQAAEPIRPALPGRIIKPDRG